MATPVRPNDFVSGEKIYASEVNEDLDTIYGWADTDAIHRDASRAFTTLPSGPGGGVQPSTDAQLSNKLYVDNQVSGLAATELAARGGVSAYAISSKTTSAGLTLADVSGWIGIGTPVGASVVSGGIILSTPGVWMVTATISWQTNATGDRWISLNALGSPQAASRIDAPADSTGTGCFQTVSAPIPVGGSAEGVTFAITQNSGSTLTYTARLMAVRIY